MWTHTKTKHMQPLNGSPAFVGFSAQLKHLAMTLFVHQNVEILRKIKVVGGAHRHKLGQLGANLDPTWTHARTRRTQAPASTGKHKHSHGGGRAKRATPKLQAHTCTHKRTSTRARTQADTSTDSALAHTQGPALHLHALPAHALRPDSIATVEMFCLYGMCTGIRSAALLLVLAMLTMLPGTTAFMGNSARGTFSGRRPCFLSLISAVLAIITASYVFVNADICPH